VHRLIDATFELPIAVDPLRARNGYLDIPDLVAQSGIPLEKPLECL
jgi:hypothetical protein